MFSQILWFRSFVVVIKVWLATIVTCHCKNLNKIFLSFLSLISLQIQTAEKGNSVYNDIIRKSCTQWLSANPVMIKEMFFWCKLLGFHSREWFTYLLALIVISYFLLSPVSRCTQRDYIVKNLQLQCFVISIVNPLQLKQSTHRCYGLNEW